MISRLQLHVYEENNGYEVFSPANDNQRLQGYQNVCLEFSIRLLIFSVPITDLSFVFIDQPFRKSKSIFWP